MSRSREKIPDEEDEDLPLVVFTYGRMNPPHKGHMGLLQEMMHIALDEESNKVVILLSSSNDPEKNPLRCEQKKILALEKGMIQKAKENIERDASNLDVYVFCPEDLGAKNNASSMINSAIPVIFEGRPPEKVRLIMLVGEDRASQFDWVARSVSPNNFESRFSSRPEGGISATRIRGHVKSNNRDDFMRDMEGTGLDLEAVDTLYTAIETGMSKKEETPKSRTVKRKIQPTPKSTLITETSRKRKTIEPSINSMSTNIGKETKKEKVEVEEVEEPVKIGGKRRRTRKSTRMRRRKRCTRKHRHSRKCRK